MERNKEKRLDVTHLFPGAVSVICLTHNYYNPEQLFLSDCRLSRYAYGNDYHEVLKVKMRVLLDYLCERIPGVSGRVFVDSAPLLERALAVEAGLGWIGKNSMLIVPGAGTYFFLSEIVVTAELDYDEPFKKNYCGSCTSCLDSCPTGALRGVGVVDASRCISYCTIEQRAGETDAGVISKSNYIFGCDICQDSCPWNRFASPHEEPSFNARAFASVNLDGMDAEQISELLRGSPLCRAGVAKLRECREMLKR